ncbi:MAG: efflux RND transporter permease subunit [Pleurocapsa sp. CRU_1_2]|nr:efflux RND transporter permease subunit [Pleurocapsa sp. CRU_1_2]
MLQWALNHRRAVIGIAIGSFVAGIALIPLIPQGFIPQLDRGEFKIVYTTPLPKIAGTKVNSPSQDVTSQKKPVGENGSMPSAASQTPSKSNFSWLTSLARSLNEFYYAKRLKSGRNWNR